MASDAGCDAAAQGLVEILYNTVQALLYSSIVYFMVGFDISVGEDPHCTIYLSRCAGSAEFPALLESFPSMLCSCYALHDVVRVSSLQRWFCAGCAAQ